MTNPFSKAVKTEIKLRFALYGPSGSGKTYSALRIASHLGKKIAVIDTEHGSARKYADDFEFDVLELDNFDPKNYIAALKAAEQNGYDVVIIDSFSHAWAGTGGVLEIVDKESARNHNNSYVAWRKGTPVQNALVEALLASKVHIIATMRSKTDYVIEDNEKGRKAPRKVGLAPIQRQEIEYEFDIVGEMNIDHDLVITKTRNKQMADLVVNKPGEEVAEMLNAWLNDGAPMRESARDLAARTFPWPEDMKRAKWDPSAENTTVLLYAIRNDLSIEPERAAEILGVELTEYEGVTGKLWLDLCEAVANEPVKED